MKLYNNGMFKNINNRLFNTESKASKSLQKLSSGLRINSAADDSAGLSISERIKTQIRGLDQAERNIQDGISLLQTAEGGLNNILEPPLQRMRELCIQASNGVLTDEDKNQIQQEIDQIKLEINATANNTQFNGIKLLDGSLKKVDIDSLSQESQTPLAIAWEKDFSKDSTLINSITSTKDGGVVVAGAKNTNYIDSISWVEKYDTKGTLLWSKQLPKKNQYNVVYDAFEANNGDLILTSNSKGNNIDDTSEPILYRLDAYGNIVNSSIQYGTMRYICSIKEIKQDNTIIATGFEGDGSYGVVLKMDPDFSVKEAGFYNERYSNIKGSVFPTDIVKTIDNGYLVIGETLDSDAPDGERGFIMKLKSDLSYEWTKTINDSFLSSAIQTDDNGFLVLGEKLHKIDSNGNEISSNSNLWHRLDGNNLNNNLVQKTIDDNNYIIASQNKITKVDSNGNEIWDLNLLKSNSRSVAQLNDGSYIVADDLNHIVKYNSDIQQVHQNLKNKDSLRLQIGANADDFMDINIGDVTENGLGLSAVSIKSDAQNSISIVDNAIRIVSAERSLIGSYQNALTHISQNNSNYRSLSRGLSHYIKYSYIIRIILSLYLNICDNIEVVF